MKRTTKWIIMLAIITGLVTSSCCGDKKCISFQIPGPITFIIHGYTAQELDSSIFSYYDLNGQLLYKAFIANPVINIFPSQFVEQDSLFLSHRFFIFKFPNQTDTLNNFSYQTNRHEISCNCPSDQYVTYINNFYFKFKGQIYSTDTIYITK